MAVFCTPRFSYAGPETVICTCPRCHRSPPAATSRGAVPGCGTGGYTGWVYQGGYMGGLYRYTQPAARGAHPDSGAGPVAPAGAEWVVRVGGRTGDGGGPRTHPCGARSGTQVPSLVLGPYCRLSANRARFPSFLSKVSQNGEVSSEKSEKACHSPYIQNGSQKSPLEILRFPFEPAFSHKELMVPF